MKKSLIPERKKSGNVNGFLIPVSPRGKVQIEILPKPKRRGTDIAQRNKDIDFAKRSSMFRTNTDASRVNRSNDMSYDELDIVKIPSYIRPKVIGLDSNGNVKKVETSDSVIKVEYGYSEKDDGEVDTEDPILSALNATVFINPGKNIDPKLVTDINSKIKNESSKYQIKLRKLPEKIDRKKWETYLEIYQNNQDYYCERLEKGFKVKIGVNKLENWFCDIIEPKGKGRRSREDFKVKNGHSYYCDKKLIHLLEKVNVSKAAKMCKKWKEKK